MKKKPLVMLGILGAAAVLSWPHLHYKLLHGRIMHVASGDEVHIDGIVGLDRVIVSLDPPMYVYQILWELATDLRDTPKASFARYTLLRICEETWIPSTGDFYDRDRWLRDMDSFMGALALRSDLSDAQKRMLEALVSRRASAKEK